MTVFTSRRWMKLREVAEMCRMHYQTAGDLWRSGELPGVKRSNTQSGRVLIPVEAVEAWLVEDRATLAQIRRELEAARTRQRARGPRKPAA